MEVWIDLSKKIAERPGLALLIGASDTGKTTLAKFLINEWTRQGLKVAYVDGDMGQSTLGPPGTLGMKVFDRSSPDLENSQFSGDISLFFIGSFSPVGHLLQTIVGVQELVKKAEAQKPDLILVDTTGLVHGGVGGHLKYRKIQLLQPRHVVLIQKSDELEHLNMLIQKERVLVHVLRPAPEIKTRSLEIRRNYRIQKLREYFGGAKVHRVQFPNAIIWGSEHFVGLPLSDNDLHFCSQILEGKILYGEKGGQTLFLIKKDFVFLKHEDTLKAKYNVSDLLFTNYWCFENRLTALYNKSGDILTLGILKKFDFERRELELLGHLQPWDVVAKLEIGKEKVDYL
jgi:polynucleotide 5'-hydroxyl-kinase GRC3/NOL9